MNYIYKWETVVLAIGVTLGLPAIAQAQEHPESLTCYMQLSDKSVVNLMRLCERNVLPYATTAKVSLAEQQNRFLKDFYQQVQRYPEGKDVLAQVDSDALIGKANLVCTALKENTYEQPQINPNANEPDSRKIANLEDAIVDQIARRSFCPEVNH